MGSNRTPPKSTPQVVDSTLPQVPNLSALPWGIALIALPESSAFLLLGGKREFTRIEMLRPRVDL
jgi:hypothetical protein